MLVTISPLRLNSRLILERKHVDVVFHHEKRGGKRVRKSCVGTDRFGLVDVYESSLLLLYLHTVDS